MTNYKQPGLAAYQAMAPPASSVLSLPVLHQAEEHHFSLEENVIYFYHQLVKDNGT